MRAGPSANVVVMIERPAGAVNAALTPLTKRVDDEERAVVREAAERGGDDEDAERDQEHPPAAEQVGGAAAEQQEAAVAEHVGADDPLERARRHVQVGADRGKRDADHRHVERVEEEGAAQHEQRTPRAPAELIGLRDGCCC